MKQLCNSEDFERYFKTVSRTSFTCQRFDWGIPYLNQQLTSHPKYPWYTITRKFSTNFLLLWLQNFAPEQFASKQDLEGSWTKIEFKIFCEQCICFNCIWLEKQDMKTILFFNYAETISTQLLVLQNSLFLFFFSKFLKAKKLGVVNVVKIIFWLFNCAQYGIVFTHIVIVGHRYF